MRVQAFVRLTSNTQVQIKDTHYNQCQRTSRGIFSLSLYVSDGLIIMIINVIHFRRLQSFAPLKSRDNLDN